MKKQCDVTRDCFDKIEKQFWSELKHLKTWRKVIASAKNVTKQDDSMDSRNTNDDSSVSSYSSEDLMSAAEIDATMWSNVRRKKKNGKQCDKA